MNPLDRERLAHRIERLQRQSTHGWMPGDELEFSNQLPNSRVRDPRRKLPTVEQVRSEDFTPQQYRNATQRCLRMESLISQNRPTSMRRIIHDMRRGRPPGFRR